VLALFVIVAGLLALFAGYPIISHYAKRPESTLGGFNIGGTNGTGQVPVVLSQLRLRDNDTPASANTWRSATGETYNLVFSDEFNQPGRTFWPGDDPFWEAMDIWYGATGDYEWLSPEQVNTTDGHLLITMENRPTHNLNFRSGQLQSWNKFCFQGGYIECASRGSGAFHSRMADTRSRPQSLRSCPALVLRRAGGPVFGPWATSVSTARTRPGSIAHTSCARTPGLPRHHGRHVAVQLHGLRQRHSAEPVVAHERPDERAHGHQVRPHGPQLAERHALLLVHVLRRGPPCECACLVRPGSSVLTLARARARTTTSDALLLRSTCSRLRR
jgi:hypothetical protein